MDRVRLSRSQQNLYNGVLQDADPGLYLIGKSYRFHPLELSRFLAALHAAIMKNPVQLCVLAASATGEDYPDLVARLQCDDIVCVQPDGECRSGADELTRMWSAGLLAQPLVRYTVRTNARGAVSGFDVFTHHLLLDGGATGIVEADLAHYLSANDDAEMPGVSAGLTKLRAAHLRETTQVVQAQQRLADLVRRELAEEAHHSGGAQPPDEPVGGAAKGVLHESIALSRKVFDAICALSASKQVPLNVLVAAAAVAVHASLRQSTEVLLVHAVDNRFGEPDLDVATCLVNSVAHTIRFAPFASIHDVVSMLDRGYVRAVRRRWLREEHYRRTYLAINRTSHVAALTLNFIREPCAPGLRPFLSEVPVATDIGPVEGMTVAAVLDENQHTLNLAIWNRVDLPASKTPRVANRIVAALESMAACWDQPLAGIVDEWFGISPDGIRRLNDATLPAEQPPVAAWFFDAVGGVQGLVDRRHYVSPWLAWLVRSGAAPGDVMVVTDDNTDKTIDFLIACHLAGCGYHVCDTADDLQLRANSIADHSDGAGARVVDVAAVQLLTVPVDEHRELVNQRLTQVAHDPRLAAKTAYIMATSGSTGQPKLVRITHGSLALFCTAVGHAYGWGTDDTVLQCAPLTSDISVEEIFASLRSGSTLIRSTAMRTGDLAALAQECLDQDSTVLDLPTAVWHLLCEDGAALDMIRRSRLRQVIIGGEAIRSSAVDKWIDLVDVQRISLISSYGPTETTVIVTYLPIVHQQHSLAGNARLRLGRPILPNTVFLAFGEIVIVGELVSPGYLGINGGGFGTVTGSDGAQRRAFATADRATVDDEGFPVFAGRKDAVVKISGKRVDTAQITKRICEDPAVSDVAVELRKIGPGHGLGVWFQTQRTHDGAEDAPAAARVRRILVSLGVSSFFVVGVPNIPRKPNGTIDSARLPALPQGGDAVSDDASGSDERAAGLAQLWSRHLGRTIRADSSLLAEGVGSLDLIRILPDTRTFLDRQLSLLDLIGADCAANLVFDLAAGAPKGNAWIDPDTAAALERDLAALCRQPAAQVRVARPRSRLAEPAIVVLGASGILGTGFARAVLELRQSGMQCPEVVLVTRSAPPDRDPWVGLRDVAGVRIQQMPFGFDRAGLDALIRGTGAGTLINCVGNTNVLVPYRELRPANVELVAAVAQACASHGARLVHASTFVVTADVAAPRVTDPRESPYPYAASKSLAELAVAGSPQALDFTIARLPRVLGEDYQLRDCADILVSVVDACLALTAYPALSLTEEVTTGRAAAKSILGLVPELAGSAELGRTMTVVRGEPVSYTTFLSGYGLDELDIAQWKHQLDQSDWAKHNPRRWSVVDAWVSLGMRLGARSYAEYLAQYPSLALGVESGAELVALPESIRDLIARARS